MLTVSLNEFRGKLCHLGCFPSLQFSTSVVGADLAAIADLKAQLLRHIPLQSEGRLERTARFSRGGRGRCS